LFVLGCEDNEGLNGLRVWGMIFWGLVDNGNKVEGVEGACGLLKGLKLTVEG